ncbi:MAG: flippase [Candidatus Staskawiczbacteria bacterium]|nr:flippase [Candidatus Staskawiczbacteria bacterium]
MSSYLKFAKHTFIIGALNALGTAQSLVFLPIITKILGVEDYGVWTQLKITLGLLVPFSFLGLNDAIVRFLPSAKSEAEAREGVYSSLFVISGVALIFALFLIIFSGPLSLFFRFDPIFVKLLSVIIIFEALSAALFNVIQARREIGKYFLFMISKIFGEAGLIIGAIMLGWGLYGAVFAFLFIRIIFFLILFVYVIRKISIKIPDFSMLKDYLRFGMPTLINNISYPVVTSADRYVIGFFLGIAFVGYYAPAYSLGMLLTFFLIPVNFMLLIVLPKLFDEKNINEVKNYLSNSLKYYSLIMIPSVFGVSILSRQLLIILSTKEIADNAYFVVPFIAVSIFVFGITCFFSQILLLSKKTKLISVIWGVAALLNLILNIIFIPKFGIIAAAITTLMSYSCALILAWHFSLKELKINIDWSFMSKITASSVLMSLLVAWFYPLGLVQVALAIILGVFVYGFLVFLFKCVGKKEIIFLKNLTYEMVSFNK